MGIFTWIITGLIAGFIAKVIAKKAFGVETPGGLIATLLLGVAGGLLGGWLASALFNTDTTASNPSWIAAIVGSGLVIAIYNWFTSRGAEPVEPRYTTGDHRDY